MRPDGTSGHRGRAWKARGRDLPQAPDPGPVYPSSPGGEERPAPPRAARIIVADDHALLRAGMGTVLGHLEDIEVVGEAANGREAVELCLRMGPDLVLMDVGMPEMDGIQATREIKRHRPEVSVLMFTAHPNPDYLLEAIRAGAAGYILKTSPVEEVSEAVRRVIRNEFPLDQGLTMHLLRRLADEASSRTAPAEPARDILTARETDVLRRLAEGKTNRQIAGELHLSLSTVKRHLERIISRLEVSDRTQAAVRAAELGLLSGRNGPPDPRK